MGDYLNFVIQVQSLGADAVAQVRFDGKVSPIIRLPALGEILEEETSMDRALFRFLFPDYSADKNELLSEHYLRQTGTWLRQAMQEARAQEKRLRIRLQINETPEPASLTELESIGLFREQENPDEEYQRKARKINWISILPWEFLLYGLWLTQTEDQTGGGEEQWREWIERGPSLVRALPPGGHLSEQNSADGEPNPVLQVVLAWADPRVDGSCRQFTDTKGERQVKWIEEEFLQIEPDSDHAYEIHEPLPRVTYERLGDYLEKNRVDVLHLLTHGDLDKDERVGYARLFFENPDGNPDPITGNRLRDVLYKGKQVPQVVFLHACQSATTTLHLQQGVAQCLINGGVKYVVAMQAKVNMCEAALFARTFYAALADRVSIDQAMSEARAKLVERNLMAERPGNPLLERAKGTTSLPAWTVPILFMHDEADGWLKQGKLAKAIRCLRDGKVMILIESPGGNFYVDKYPVTGAQYEAYVKDANAPKRDNVWKEIGGSGADSFPATSVSLQDAEGYARHVGKDLPTLAQWRWAATGGGDITAYPWGDAFEEGRCNSLEYWSGPPKPTSVTEFDPQNDAGVCDIVGNIAEVARDDERCVCCGGRHRDPREKVVIYRPSPPSFSGPLPSVGFRCVATVAQYVRWLTDDQVEEADQDVKDTLL